MEPTTTLLIGALIVSIATGIGLWLRLHALHGRLGAQQESLAELAESRAEARFANWKHAHERRIRKDAVTRSQAVTLGKVTEHLVPFRQDFDFNPKDVRFLGSPIDLVIFDGLSEGTVREVVFLEIKTGSSTLSTRERTVRDAVKLGRVRWEEFRCAAPASEVGPSGSLAECPHATSP